jgi:hypothetical protein
MRFERVLDRFDHVIAAVFSRNHDLIAQDGARADVDDDKQPDSLHLELVLNTRRIMDHYLEPDIEAVSVEFDDLIWAGRRRRGGIVAPTWQALEMRSAC